MEHLPAVAEPPPAAAAWPWQAGDDTGDVTRAMAVLEKAIATHTGPEWLRASRVRAP